MINFWWWHVLILEKLAEWTNLIFCMMLPIGVVLCIPSQYQVFPPLAAIIAARHLSSRAWLSSPRLWGGLSILVIVWPNSSQICSMVFSLAILQAAPSWWHCPAEGNQGLLEHSELWRYRLGSGSFPWYAAWQTALRCFTKCPFRAHWWGICQGACKRAVLAPLWQHASERWGCR